MAEQDKKKTLGSILFGSDTNNIVNNATTAGKFLTPASQAATLRKQGAQGTKGTTVGDNSGTGANTPAASTPAPKTTISSNPTDNQIDDSKRIGTADVTQTTGNTTFESFQPEQTRSGIGNSNDLIPTSLQNTTGNKTTLSINDGVGGNGTIVSDRALSTKSLVDLKDTIAFNATRPQNTENNSPSSSPSLGNRDALVGKLESAIRNDDQRSQAIYLKLLQNFDDNATTRIGQQVGAQNVQNRTNAAAGIFQTKAETRRDENQQALYNDTLKQIGTEFTKNPIFSPGQAGALYKTRIGQTPDSATVDNLVNLSGEDNLNKLNEFKTANDRVGLARYLLQDSGFDEETVKNYIDSLD